MKILLRISLVAAILGTLVALYLAAIGIWDLIQLVIFRRMP